jgi:hypothetical protein
MNIRFACPGCERPGRLDLPGETTWQCAKCKSCVEIASGAEKSGLHRCLLCENEELYKKKNFPHWLGLTILTLACLGSIIPYYLYHQWLTWTILIGSALFDGLLYLWVGDVVVCYRCGAHFRSWQTLPEHRPFDLGVQERYRQEQIRRSQLHIAKNGD